MERNAPGEIRNWRGGLPRNCSSQPEVVFKELRAHKHPCLQVPGRDGQTWGAVILAGAAFYRDGFRFANGLLAAFGVDVVGLFKLRSHLADCRMARADQSRSLQIGLQIGALWIGFEQLADQASLVLPSGETTDERVTDQCNLYRSR